MFNLNRGGYQCSACVHVDDMFLSCANNYVLDCVILDWTSITRIRRQPFVVASHYLTLVCCLIFLDLELQLYSWISIYRISLRNTSYRSTILH